MVPSADPFFATVRREPRATSAGPCELPILYWNASMAGLLYRVDPERAHGLCDRDFEPWVLLGRALAMFCFFEYRESSIGDYGEVGLGLLVKRKGTRPSLLGALRDMRTEKDCGLNVVNLPVTTEAARAAGSELWGYPKYVSRMDMQFRSDGVRFALGNELVMTMGPARGFETGGLPFVLYSVSREARILRTVIDVDHRQRWGGGGSVTLDVGGDGPTGRTVRALGLDTMKPSLTFRTDGMRSILPGGVDMGASSENARGVSAVAGAHPPRAA